jgi:membrane associated rhomboid family serine protease
MQDPRNQSPFNALPPEIVGLAVVLAGIELSFQAGTAGFVGGQEGVGWRLTAIRDWAVFDPLFAWMLQTGQLPAREVARLLTYPLIHGSFGHAAFVVVFVLAIGNAVAPVYRGWRVLAIFWAGALAGALAYIILFSTERPLFGGYPGAYALIGAFTLLTRKGLTRARQDQAFLLIGFLLALGPIFGVATGQGFGWMPDWVADIAGFAAGYGLSVLLFPGGWGRIRDRARRR